MSKTEIQEKLIEFAQRVPPGDRWQVMHVNTVQNGLTEAVIVDKPEEKKGDEGFGNMMGMM